MGLDYTKDYELVKLDITPVTGGQPFSLRYVFLELAVYEELFNNNITMDLTLNDANNMLMNMPIFGYETILVEFRTPDKELWSKTFRVIKVSDRILMKDRQQGFILHCVTPEAIMNMQTRATKAYKGKLISEMVEDIHTNILGGGPIEIEKTKYQHHKIVPSVSPVQAINWLSTCANSSQFEGSNYLYYEDRNSFKFVSMESRVSQPPAQTYLFQPANVRKDGNLNHKSPDFETNTVAVEHYTFKNHSDIIENMQSGMYGNELLTHSHAKKQWQRYKFDYQKSFNDYKHLHENHLDSKMRPDANAFNSKLKLQSTGHDADSYDFLSEKWLPMRISQLQQLHNTHLELVVPGDSERTVGEVVTFNLPSPEQPIDNKQVEEKYLSGNYLIQSIRHIIDQNKYRTVMTLIKDSVPEQYP